MSFSDATFELCYKQKRRALNSQVFFLYNSGVSLRRLALHLRANRKTIVRKFRFLAALAPALLNWLNSHREPVTHLQFDDMESHEHSKLKPLSMSVAVDGDTRWIVGIRVAVMPAKGKTAAISRKKYGRRPDERPQAREELFTEIREFVAEDAVVWTDMNPHYDAPIKRHFPKSPHRKTKVRRGCVVGQGELKRGGRDPLFPFNHTAAMLRANVNRLFRRTWNTTKLKERLSEHIVLYALFHNLVLIG